MLSLRNNMTIRPHAGQFSIGEAPWQFASATKHLVLPRGQVLSYCEPLIVTQVARDAWVMGAVEEGNRDEPPLASRADAPAMNTAESLIKASRTWVGRWLGVVGGELVSDCWGSMSVLWRTIGGETRAYSSLGLLKLHAGEPPADERIDFDLRRHGAPRSGVARLWPVSALDLASMTCRDLQCPRFNVPQRATPDEVADALAQLGTTAVERLHRRTGLPFLVGLTGGRDSRTVFVIAAKAGLPARSFTFLKPWMNMTPHDRNVPKTIARRFGTNHCSVKAFGRELRADLRTEVEKHLGFRLGDIDVPGSNGYYLARDLWKHTGPRSIYLNSFFFDLIQGRYADFRRKGGWFESAGWRIDEGTAPWVAEMLALAVGSRTRADDLVESAGLDYWTYNQWSLQSVMTATDLSEHVVMPIGVCAALNELGLACENADLCASRPQRSFLARYAPELSDLRLKPRLKEPIKYLDYLRRGAPGLGTRIAASLGRLLARKGVAKCAPPTPPGTTPTRQGGAR